MTCLTPVARSISLVPLLFLLGTVSGLAWPSDVHSSSTSAVAPDNGVAAVAEVDTTEARVLQPGAPGQPSRVLEDGERIQPESPAHTEADVRFMQHMIVHHAQALEMTALVPDRTDRDEFRLMAERMERSQADEIALMAQWLMRRDAVPPPIAEEAEQALAVPYPAGQEAGISEADGHGSAQDHTGMPGILSEEQMAQLAAASGEEFERLFLEFMIFHHEGAIRMVEELFASPGGGQESTINTLAVHIEADQQMEIERMRRMLAAY